MGVCLRDVYERWCLSRGFPFLLSFKAGGLSIFDRKEGGPAVVIKLQISAQVPPRIRDTREGQNRVRWIVHSLSREDLREVRVLKMNSQLISLQVETGECLSLPAFSW